MPELKKTNKMREDYILKQINQVAQVLAAILSKVFDSSKTNSFEQTFEQTNNLLKDHLNLDIDELIQVDQEEFIITLKEKYSLKNEELTHFGDIIFELANQKSSQNQPAHLLYQKAGIIYKYLEIEEEIFSLDRHFKLEQIEKENLDKFPKN